MAFDLVEMCSSRVGGRGGGDPVDPLTFCQATWGLGITPFPAQRFILKAFYGMELDDKVNDIVVKDKFADEVRYVLTEKDFCKFLFDEGRINVPNPEGMKFYELVLVCGRRSGKSVLATSLAWYEIYKLLKKRDPQGHYKIHESAEISATSISTAESQATKLFSQYLHFSNFSDFIRTRKVGKPSSNAIRLVTDKEREVLGNIARGTVYLDCGGCSAKSARGSNNIVVVLDELAHFIDTGGRFSGDAIYNALMPSIASFGNDGKFISISSPLAKHGVFWDLYQSSFESKKMLMIQAPSSYMNPRLASEFLHEQYEKDPLNFSVEYEAEFSDKLKGWMKDDRILNRCISIRGANRSRAKGRYYYGVDLGVKQNGSAVAITHKEDGIIVLDFVQAYYPGMGEFGDDDILDLREIARLISELTNEYPVASGMIDQWNGHGFLGHLDNLYVRGFELCEIGEARKAKMFNLAKSLIINAEVQLYKEPVDDELGTMTKHRRDRWDPKRPGRSLITEFGKLEEKQTSRGNTVVNKPNDKGAQDDATDAVIRAIWLCHEKTAGISGGNRNLDRFGRSKMKPSQKMKRQLKGGYIHGVLGSVRGRGGFSLSKLLEKVR